MCKFELPLEQRGQAAIIALSISHQTLQFMEENDTSLDTMIEAITITLGALIAQRERVQVKSTMDTTTRMVEVCIATMRNDAIAQPSPSAN
jgi:hypothetical protein